MRKRLTLIVLILAALAGTSLGAGLFSDPSGQPLVLPVLVGGVPVGVTIVDPG